MADNRPLRGVVVLDLTRVLAGPFCTMILRDLGAEVVKIEPPAGDDARAFGPFLAGADTASAYFTSLNCGKRSVVLDLKQPADAGRFAELVEGADVLVENYRPGTLARLGFGEERLRELNPELVYAAISGFGATGPYADRPAYDMIIQALSGLVSITGTEAGERVRVGTSIADIVSGLYAAVGVLAALGRRAHGGGGARIDLSMLDAAVSVLENAVARYQVNGEVPVPLGSRHPAIAPFEAFAAADGQVVIAAGNDRLFTTLCDVVGRSELPRDPRFSSNPERVAHVGELKEALEAALGHRRVAEWVAALTDAGVPVAQVNTVADLFDDPQLAARGMLTPVAGLDGFRVTGSPLKFDGVAEERQRPPAPSLGQHNDAPLAGA